MHISLWIWNRNSIIIKLLLNFFGRSKENIPVIRGFHPDTNSKIHTIVTKSSNNNYRCRVLQNLTIIVYQ